MHLSLKSLYHNQSHTFSGFLSTRKCLCPRSLAYHIISSKVPPQHHKYAILWSHIINSSFKQSNLFAFPTNTLSSVGSNLYGSLTPQSFPVLLFSPLLKITLLILLYLASSFSFTSLLILSFIFIIFQSMCDPFLEVFPNSEIEFYIPLLHSFNNRTFIPLITYTPEG